MKLQHKLVKQMFQTTNYNLSVKCTLHVRESVRRTCGAFLATTAVALKRLSLSRPERRIKSAQMHVRHKGAPNGTHALNLHLVKPDFHSGASSCKLDGKSYGHK